MRGGRVAAQKRRRVLTGLLNTLTVPLNLLLVAGLTAGLRRWSGRAPLRLVFWPALLFKLGAGVALGLVYQRQAYVGDTFTLFGEARPLSALARHDVGTYVRTLAQPVATDPGLLAQLISAREPRSFFFVKIISLFNLLTGDNYWLTGLYGSLLGFAGLWAMANALARRFAGTGGAAAVACLFFPSVVFWGAGVLKESLATGAIGAVVAVALAGRGGWSGVARWAGAALLVAGLWLLKYHYCLALVACVGAGTLTDTLARRGQWSRGATVARFGGILLGLVAGGSLLHPNLRADHLLQAVADTHRALHDNLNNCSAAAFADWPPTWPGLLRHAPVALFTGLFRPLPWEARGWLDWPVATENVALLTLSRWAAARWRPQRALPAGALAWTLAALVYVVGLATMLTLATPNFGTLARYKVAYLPVLVYLLLVTFQRNLFPTSQSLPPNAP